MNGMEKTMEKNNLLDAREQAADGIEDVLTFADKRTVGAVNAKFTAAAERMHRNHPALNRTLTTGFVLVLLAVVIAAFAMRQFLFEPTLVDGESMETTLMNGERVAVSKAAYWFREPQRGDIVIVHYPNRQGRFVKRIIAFGGETITLNNGYVMIDGKKLDESAYAGDWYGNINLYISTHGSVNGVYTVPEGHVFVMGDNRNISHDSRSADVGPIANEQVLGKAFAAVWPLSRFRWIG